MTIRTTLLSVAVLVIVVIGWWLMPPFNHPPTQVMIVNDRSDSTPNDCDSLTTIFQNALKLPGINRHSTVTVVSIGDERTANEPYYIGRYLAPDTRYIIEGKRKIETKQNELVADLASKCAQSPVTKVSPIYLAVKRAVEQLESMGSNKTSALYLFVKTDGEETADKQIAVALQQSPGTKTTLPSQINNEKVQVNFCGMAETIGKEDGTNRGVLTATRNSRRIDRAREVWSALFSHPSQVNFEPYCPKVADSQLTKRKL